MWTWPSVVAAQDKASSCRGPSSVDRHLASRRKAVLVLPALMALGETLLDCGYRAESERLAAPGKVRAEVFGLGCWTSCFFLACRLIRLVRWTTWGSGDDDSSTTCGPPSSGLEFWPGV